MKGWKCLDCAKRWDGPAVEVVKDERGRKQAKLTEVGEAVKLHVLTFSHSCAPEAHGG